MENITWTDFTKVELRVGKIIQAEEFPEAKKPAFKLTVDFGPDIGVKKSSARITDLYKLDALLGKLVVAVVNFPPKQIANFMSECLVLGVVLENKEVVLLQSERTVPNGLRIA